STTEEFVVYDHIKLNTSINCDVVVNDYDVTLTVNVNESSATGFVEINIAGKTYYVLVENGKAVFVSDFIPGTYSCNVTYLGDDYFNPAETIVSFTVSQKNDSLANTTIDVEIGGFENDVIITAFVNESATGLIEFIIEDKAVYIAVNNGKAVYDVVLPAGEYNVMVTYLGDYKFSSNSTSRDFIVQDHMKLNTSIAGNVSVDGYNVTLTAEVIKFATGFVEFSLNGNSIFAELNDGVAVVNAVFLSGEYTVTATYLGDDDFNSNSTNITFRVDEIPQNETSIDSIVEINENNVTITVIVNENATGFVEFDFIGAESFTYYAPVIDGIAVYGGVLAAGRYVVEITYLGDEKFDTNTTTERFEVTGHIKKNTTLDCDVSVNGYLVNLTVNLESDATGFVCFFTGASEYYAPINDGKAVLMFNMHPGNYTFTVVYDGDENYNSANATVEIYVPEIEPEDANLTVSAVNSTITVTVNEEATGYVLVDVDGTGYYAIIEDGQATVNVIGLDEGEYEASVIYSGDDVFAPANATVSVTVPSSGKNDTPVDPEANISISAEGVEVSLPEDATGYVLIDVDGTGYYTAVENGKATFELPKLDLGNHTVSVTYTGDNKYASANATANVTIDGPVETIISDNLTKVEKAPDRFEAVFTDAEGNPLANTEVTFEIKGNVYKRTTDASGKAGMNINLESGVYEVKITNPVTGEVKFNTITVKSRFEDAHDLVKYFRNDSQYRIKVLGDDGNIAPKGTVVKFNINGVFYERSVDENGYVKMNINLNPGTYIITGEYKGCRVSNTITVLPILTADDLVKKYGEANPFEAKLVDGQGNPYANQKLEFNINGVFYYRTTNSNGIAKLNINLMPSAYIITTRYGDAALSNNVIVTT
ncbi:Ig-like domain-containing protein, partial [Methanobrevibacter millerae]